MMNLSLVCAVMVMQPSMVGAQPESPGNSGKTVDSVAPASAPAAAADPLAALAATTPFAGEAPVLVGEGYSFTEGPCWVPASGTAPGFFVFCDVPRAIVHRWSGEGKPEVFRENSGRALGSAVDDAGVLHHCEVEGRRVTAVAMVDAKPGQTRVLAERFEGKRLNAPNDLVVARDGTIYFTDPTFFTPKEALELDFSGVYRLAKDGTLTALRRDIRLPNGIALSPDERTLYVNDFGNNLVLAMDLTQPLAATGEGAAPQLAVRTLADLGAIAKSVGVKGRGRADGLRVLADGTIITTGPGAVFAIGPDGSLRGVLAIAGVSNVALAPATPGSAAGQRMLLTAGDKVFSASLKPAAEAKPAP